jgi:hypothetical protein
MLKYYLFIIFSTLLCNPLTAQQIDSIYFNLYTDSLKKGTYNYINVDGKLTNGRFIPLDSNYLVFKSSTGIFYGNSLYIDSTCTDSCVTITTYLKNNITLQKTIIIYVKKIYTDATLSTEQDVMDNRRKKKKSN